MAVAAVRGIRDWTDLDRAKRNVCDAMDLKPQGYCKLLHRDPPEVAKRLESLLEASDAH